MCRNSPVLGNRVNLSVSPLPWIVRFPTSFERLRLCSGAARLSAASVRRRNFYFFLFYALVEFQPRSAARGQDTGDVFLRPRQGSRERHVVLILLCNLRLALAK